MALDVAAITIGDDVQIGPNVHLPTPTHPVAAEPRRAKWEAAKPITIGATSGSVAAPSCWAGSPSARNTVVGAGAVVPKDLPANVVTVGTPARAVRRL